VELNERLGVSRSAARCGVPGAVQIAQTLATPRRLAREVDVVEDICGLSHRQGAQFRAGLETVARCLGTKFADLAERGSGPRWLDVAAPTHLQVDVERGWALFHADRVRARCSDTVVVADRCELEAVDCYRIKRLSLDARGIYDDPAAFKAFTDVLENPSGETVRAFRRELKRITERAAGPAERQYRERVSAQARTQVTRSELVVLGDDSTVRGVTRYQVRETVVPLAELLRDDKDLIWAIAGRHGGNAPNRGADSIQRPVLDALRQIEDNVVLRHTRQADRNTTVWRALDTRVDLASAVMVGAGNHLIRGAEVERGHVRAGNLGRFESLVRTALTERENQRAVARSRAERETQRVEARQRADAERLPGTRRRGESGYPSRGDTSRGDRW
jgi:hypothetical protein